MALPENLLNKVKLDNGITWTDETTDTILESYITSSIAWVDSLNGLSNDYTKEGPHMDLLLNRVRYMRSNDLASFETDYRKEIIHLVNKVKADNYASSSTTTESGS